MSSDLPDFSLNIFKDEKCTVSFQTVLDDKFLKTEPKTCEALEGRFLF